MPKYKAVYRALKKNETLQVNDCHKTDEGFEKISDYYIKSKASIYAYQVYRKYGVKEYV